MTNLIIKNKANFHTLKKINEFSKKTINDKTINDLLTVNNTSCILLYHKFRLYYEISSFIYNIYITNSNYELDDNFNCQTLNNLLKNYLDGNIKTTDFYPKKLNNNFKSIFYYLLFLIIRFLIFLFRNNNFKHKNKIIIDHPQKQVYIDRKSLKERRDSTYFQYLYDIIDNDFLVIREENLPKFTNKNSFSLKKSFFIRNSNYSEFFGEFILIKALFSFKILKLLFYYSKQLKINYKIIESINLDYEEIIIFNKIKKLHKSSIFYIFRYLAYNNFFKKNKHFKSVTTTDENSPLLKTILDAAKANNIKTFGIQHGNIHDLHPAYMFTQKDKENKMMPDYTLVWGEYYKNFLSSRANYPSDSLIITGQIRTDIIPRLKEINHKILPDNIPVEKKIILFASQPQRDAALRKQAAYDVFKAASLFPDAFLLVKLHPGEFNDFEYYNDIAKEAGCNNYKIIYYFDLYLLLAASDIIITCFSTVGSETVYFYKPLIVLDHLKQDIQNYCKAGVGIQADSADSLINILTSFFKGSLKINKTAYDNFISQYAYKIDGQATQRCLNAIINNS